MYNALTSLKKRIASLRFKFHNIKTFLINSWRFRNALKYDITEVDHIILEFNRDVLNLAHEYWSDKNLNVLEELSDQELKDLSSCVEKFNQSYSAYHNPKSSINHKKFLLRQAYSNLIENMHKWWS